MDLFSIVKDSIKVLAVAFFLVIAGVWVYFKTRSSRHSYKNQDKLQHLRKRARTAVKESGRSPVKSVTLGGMDDRFAPRPLSQTQIPLRQVAQAAQAAAPARYQVLNRGHNNRPE